MSTMDWLAVTEKQALQFFFERLKDVSDDTDAPTSELLYNASVLAHFATTSTASTRFPYSPNGLTMVFDVFMMDRSQHADPEIMEAAAAQCLLLTGFFQDQVKRRHNIQWYALLGAGFYGSAAHLGRDPDRTRMMGRMAQRFEFWREQQHRLAAELRDVPKLILREIRVDPTSPF